MFHKQEGRLDQMFLWEEISLQLSGGEEVTENDL